MENLPGCRQMYNIRRRLAGVMNFGDVVNRASASVVDTVGVKWCSSPLFASLVVITLVIVLIVGVAGIRLFDSRNGFKAILYSFLATAMILSIHYYAVTTAAAYKESKAATDTVFGGLDADKLLGIDVLAGGAPSYTYEAPASGRSYAPNDATGGAVAQPIYSEQMRVASTPEQARVAAIPEQMRSANATEQMRAAANATEQMRVATNATRPESYQANRATRPDNVAFM